MAESNWWIWVGSLAVFVVIAVFFLRIIPRVMGKQCPNCLRRVPMGKAKCPACGTTVNARNDLSE